MRLRIHARNVGLAPAVREALERRLRFALGRHAGGIAVAQAAFSRLRADAEGTSVRCRIRVRMREGAELTVEDAGPDADVAARAALWRLEHRLDRVRSPRIRGGTTVPRERPPLF